MRPIFDKTFRHGIWTPAAVLLLGSLSIGLLIWTDRIDDNQRTNYVINGALMDVQIHTSVFHLWLEEFIGGNPEVDVKSIWKELDAAMNLTEAVLNGGETEHGMLVSSFKNPGMRAQAEGIKASLAEMKEVALERLKTPEKSGIISVLNQRFDKVFGTVLARASALERVVEAERLRNQNNARHLFHGILGTWALIVIIAVLGLWSRELRRKIAEEEILRLNTDLAAHAAELETANQELEAFNHTVAHDLRQPLNVVCSYCQAMEVLCGDNINEGCKGYIQETYKGALRMNSLLDALLNFSRMGHVVPNRQTVDLSVLAQEVVMTLKMTDPKRPVDFRITDRIVANADAKLLRAVLANLLGNAWKYTGAIADVVIEFGVRETGGKQVYFVRDNGVGFDKADTDKLFLPFQKLHGPDQLKGFGIGLATVERIIRRHGGRIWAEGEPGKGATFYFTLPPDNITT